MKEVARKEVLKLLETCMIYLISNSFWVSLVHVVPKEGGMIVVLNKKKQFDYNSHSYWVAHVY